MRGPAGESIPCRLVTPNLAILIVVSIFSRAARSHPYMGSRRAASYFLCRRHCSDSVDQPDSLSARLAGTRPLAVASEKRGGGDRRLSQDIQLSGRLGIRAGPTPGPRHHR